MSAGNIAYHLVIDMQRLSNTAGLFCIAVLAVAAAGGCGGSNGDPANDYSVVASTTVAAASFPEAQLVPRINSTCRSVWGKILDNFAKYSRWHENDPGTPREHFAENVRLSLMAGIDFHIFDRIVNMGAPPSQKREIEVIIGTMQSAVERAQKKLAPVGSVAEVSSLFAEYNQRARRYGLDECLVDEARLGGLET